MGVLTSDVPIALHSGLIGEAGFAYPIRGHLLDRRLGATRLGEFSTGIAREQVTDWQPGRRLVFIVISQPPAMKEMSPYRDVKAPHLVGYFETKGMSFELKALPGGRTRLTGRADNILRIDPVLYWAPLARWAIYENLVRVSMTSKVRPHRAEPEIGPAGHLDDDEGQRAPQWLM